MQRVGLRAVLAVAAFMTSVAASSAAYAIRVADAVRDWTAGHEVKGAKAGSSVNRRGKRKPRLYVRTRRQPRGKHSRKRRTSARSARRKAKRRARARRKAV